MVDKGNYSIYVPQNATGPTDVVIYYGGAWTGTDGYVYKEYVKSNPNKIVILADKVVAPTSELYNGLQDTLTSNGLTAGNIDILAHSMGDKYAVKSAIDAPNYGFHVNRVSILDSTGQLMNFDHKNYNLAYKINPLSDDQIKQFAKTGTSLVLFEQTEHGKSNLNKFIENGVPIVYIRTKVNNGFGNTWNEEAHAVINQEPIQNGYLDILGGTSDTLGMEPTAVNLLAVHNQYDFHTSKYECSVWDTTSKKWVNIPMSEAIKLIQSQGYIVDPSGVYERIKENGGELKDFSNNLMDNGDTLGSNLSYVSDAMSIIKGQLTEQEDVNYSPGSDNEASIIGAMYKASNYYNSVTNVLYGNLAAEADAVYGIANSIFQMDECASVIAETSLTDGMRNMFTANSANLTTALESLKSTSAGLYDTAKNAVMAGGRYDELSEILGTAAVSGGVGKISVSSLDSAIGSILPSLQNEIAQANGLKSSVEGFMSGIGSSNILQGGVWEDVKTNMANYSSLLECNANAATFISDTLETAMGLVVNYIQDANDEISAVSKGKYGSLASLDEIDDSRLPELVSAISEVTININDLKATITYMENKTHTECSQCLGENGGTVECNCHEVHDYTETDIAPYRTQLSEAEELKVELNAYKGVLEGFAPVVQQAQDIINDAVSQVKGAYENPVKDTEGNQTFNSDFNLDLSKYGIDDSIDYKALVNDFHEQVQSQTATETNPENQEPAGTTQKDTGNTGSPSSTPSGSPSSGGSDSGSSPSVRPTEPLTEKPTERVTEPVERPTMAPTEPWREQHTSPSEDNSDFWTIPEESTEIYDGDEIIEYPNEEYPYQYRPNEGYVNLPAGPYFDESDKPQIVLIDSETPNPDDMFNIPEFNEYSEKVYNKPQVTPLVHSTVPQEPKEKSHYITMGVGSGIGLALGAISLGAHTLISKNDKEEQEEDYGYNK